MNEKTITLTKPGRGRTKALLTLSFFSALVLGKTAQALPYAFTTIDSPGATSTALFKMNNTGQFVGTHRDASGVLHSLVTDGRTFTVFDPPGVWGSGIPGIGAAQGINDSGRIVGYVEDANNDRAHAYELTGGVFSFYDHPSAGSGNPFWGTSFTGINNAGVIVGGYADNADVQHGFIQTGNVVTEFDNLWPGPGSQAVPADINNLGQMVGSFFDVDGSGNPIQRGFFMDPSRSLLSFIDVPGSPSVFANGLNDLGDIVGAFYDDASGVFHGFVLSGGVMTVLDVPGGTGLLPGTFIQDIDNRGRLVGYYGDDLTRFYRAGIYGFLATPVSEPPALALAGIGLVVMGFARGCRRKPLNQEKKTMLQGMKSKKPRDRKLLASVCLTLATVIVGWPGTAAAFLFQVEVSTIDQLGGRHTEFVSSSILPVAKSSSQDWNETWGHAQSEAVAAAGNVVSQQLIPILSARSFAHWVQSESNGERAGETNAFAWARFVYGGFVIDGPPGVVPFSVNYEIEGGMGADHLGANMGVTSGVSFSGGIDTGVDESHFILGDLSMCERGANTRYPCLEGGPHIFASGALFGVSVPGRFSVVASSPTVIAEVGVPFEIEMKMMTSAFAFLGSSTQGSPGAADNFATALADFGNTAGLWDGGPLFNLPPGYTAHSLDGLVVDNRLRLPGPSGGGGSVPAPPTLGLLLVGAAVAAFVHRSPRRKT